MTPYAQPSAEVGDLCFVTPSFLGDIERFALLRASLRLFGGDVPHIAYVDTEDCAAFARRFGAEPGLRIVPTAAVLPPALERSRARRRGWPGRLNERLAWRLGWQAPRLSGWKLQQVIKIAALAELPYAAAVFLDSDILACAGLDRGWFFAPDGRLRLLETPATTYEDYAFEIGRQLILGGRITDPASAFNYIHQAPRFLRRTGAALLAHLSTVADPWYRGILDQAFPSEYGLLGFAARALESYAGYAREESDPAGWVYKVAYREDLDAALEACRAERGRRGFLLIQSNMKLPAAEYGPRALRLLEELAAA